MDSKKLIKLKWKSFNHIWIQEFFEGFFNIFSTVWLISLQGRRQELTEGMFLVLFHHPPSTSSPSSSLPLPFPWHHYPFPSIPPVPCPSPTSSPPSPPLLYRPFPSLPLDVGPLKPARGSGSTVSSSSGVRDRAPAEIEFGALLESHW